LGGGRGGAEGGQEAGEGEKGEEGVGEEEVGGGEEGDEEKGRSRRGRRVWATPGLLSRSQPFRRQRGGVTPEGGLIEAMDDSESSLCQGQWLLGRQRGRLQQGTGGRLHQVLGECRRRGSGGRSRGGEAGDRCPRPSRAPIPAAH